MQNSLSEQDRLSGDPAKGAASPKSRGRAQVIQAPIEGRIVRWGEGIVENARVRKGQLIAEIRVHDEAYRDRLEAQMAQARLQVDAAESQIVVMQQTLEATRKQVAASQAQAYEQVYDNLTLSNDKRVASAKKRREADLQGLKPLETLSKLETDSLEGVIKAHEAGAVSVSCLISADC